MASPIRLTSSGLQATESQSLPPALTDDILREIFLRVASPADLVRAAAACVSFCGLIADPSFLRRYRSRHQPLLLGFIDFDGLHPVQAPHPNASAARAFARTVDFSFGYIPGKSDIIDVRDGRIVVELFGARTTSVSPGDLAVCDPVSRHCHLVNPVPDGLLASAQIQTGDIITVESFLAPSEDAEGTTFGVMRCMLGKTGLVLLVFSSRSSCWSVATSISWDALSLEAPKVSYPLELRRHFHGCFYWKLNRMDKLLKLDLNTMKFSTHGLPSGHSERNVVVVEAGGGKLAMLSQSHQRQSLQYYTFSRDGGKKSCGWCKNNTVPLPSRYDWKMMDCQSEEYVFLYGIPKVDHIKHPLCLALEIKTFNVERLNGIDFFEFKAPYFGFPPIVSPRRFHGNEMD